ncbi:MAG: zinc ribbon domain-containing protein [Acidobacteria bacterium]|nr:zinc ribbon domain-containing protein [Acidobacteriota bacterium]
MPLYEYQCDACGHRFEVIQKFSDPLVEKCPKCGSAVHKLMSSPAFQFKGTGWYVTDYAKKDQGTVGDKTDSGSKTESDAREMTAAKTDTEAKTTTSQTKTTETKAEPKTESKPAAKANGT